MRPTGNDFSGSAGTVVQIGTVTGDANLAPPPPAVTELPLITGAFRDRTEVLAEMDGWLGAVEGGDPRTLWMLTAPTGYGATSTADHWIRSNAARFPGARILVDCSIAGRSRGRSAEEVCDRFLAQRGYRTEERDTAEAKLALFASVIANEHAVILLDGVHSAAQVRPFLTGAPRVVVIVTATAPVPGLRRFKPRHRELDPMAAADLAEVIADVLDDDQRGRDTDAVTALARACGGVPLIAEKAAAFVADEPDAGLADLAARMAERGRLGALGPGHGDPMDDANADPAAVFDAAYAALGPDAAALYRALGTLPVPSFDPELAGALIPEGTDDAPAALRRLVSRGTVRRGAGRRLFLDALQHEHAERTAQRELTSAERTRLQVRIADYHLFAAAAADRRLSHRWPLGPVYTEEPPFALPDFDAVDPAGWIADSLTTLIACAEDAGSWRAGGAFRAGYRWQTAVATNQYFRRHGRFDERRTLLSMGEQDADAAGDPDARARIQAQWGEALLSQHRFDEAEARFRLSLAAAEDGGDPRSVGGALEWLGIVARKRGDGAAALESLDRSEPFLDGGRARPRALHRMHRGDAHGVLGRSGTQLAGYQAALTLFAEHAEAEGADLDNEGKLHRRIGRCLLEQGDRAAAHIHAAEAVQRFRAAGGVRDEARSLELLGEVADEPGARRRHWEAARALFAEQRYDADAERLAQRIAAL